jgi:hypothetical protein
MNSLQVSEQQEAKEERVRQRRARKVSARVATPDAPDSAGSPKKGFGSSSTPAEFVPPIPAMKQADLVSYPLANMPSGYVGEQRIQSGKSYWAAYRRAMRRGLALPPLPVGERWKRRLPPACR